MIKAIIFDFGGVIVNSFPIRMEEFIAHTLCIPLKQVNKTFFSEGEDLIVGKISEYFFWEKYFKSLNRELPDNWYYSLTNYLINNISVNADSMKIVRFLKKRKFLLPLLSNISPLQMKLFQKMNYFSFFNPLIFSCEVGLKKPDPKIFDLVCQKIDLEPHECLFIDDDKKNISIANDLGFNVIRFTSAQNTLMDLSTFI